MRPFPFQRMLSFYLFVSTNLMCLSSNTVTCVAFKPDNPNIVVSGSDKTIKTWDITSGSCLSTLKVDGRVSSVTFSMDGSKIAAAFNVYKAFGDFQCGGVKIFSNQGSAGFACQSTMISDFPSRRTRYAPSLSRECFLSFG